MTNQFEVLSAVLDGESVDVEQLETALDDPRGRLMFVDFVKLRQLGLGDGEIPSVRLYHAASRSGLLQPAGSGKRRIPVSLAAAAVVLAMVLGWVFNSNSIRQENAPDMPPEPVRVLRFERGVDWR
jgi:hypothetical protein